MGKIISRNPATAEILREIEAAGEAEVREAVRKGREAAPAWAALSFRTRRTLVLKIRDEIYRRRDEIARLISEENGKPLAEALSADIVPVLELATYFAKQTERILRRERIWLGKWNFMGRTSFIDHEPLGVIGIIAPWNFPFSIPCGQVLMALMAGNTVVLKPSELTPLVGLKIGEIVNSVGLPPRVFQVLPGDGATGAALVGSGVDKILFTGSVATGKRIMEAASKSLTPVALELGGKDPMIVLEDADLEVASSAAVWGAFSNAGQICSSVERLYLHEKIAAPFLQKCLEKTVRLKQGSGLDPDVEVGPMISESQLEKVEAQVKAALAAGAKALTGGERDFEARGWFFRPTILTNVTHGMEVMTEETFGPVVGVMSFGNDDEAIRLANDSRFGLTASVWSRDLGRARKLAARLAAGTVTINENVYTYALAQTPWGGPKESGIGRTHGKLGLLEMVQPKHVHINRAGRIKDLWWYSYDQAKLAMLSGLAGLFYAKGISARVKGLLGLIRGAMRSKVL